MQEYMKNALAKLSANAKAKQNQDVPSALHTSSHATKPQAPTPSGYDKKALANEFKGIWGGK